MEGDGGVHNQTLGKQVKDYNPEEEAREMEFTQIIASSKTIDRQEETSLKHGEEGGMIYKYDLQIVNEPILFHNKLMKIDE